jgi:hypothetical protein
LDPILWQSLGQEVQGKKGECKKSDNQAANKLVDAGGIWFEDVGSTPTASIF